MADVVLPGDELRRGPNGARAGSLVGASPLAPIDPAAVKPSPEDEIIRRSVVQPADYPSIPPTDTQFVLWLATVGDGIQPWGRAPKLRDRQLRDFITQEPWFNSALGTVCAQHAAFDWKLDGPDKLVTAIQEMLLNSNRGAGWEDFITKLTIDLLTQDLGAYIELIRAKDDPASPVINIATLDAIRCWPTGHPQIPVIYQDRKGRLHRLAWYQVINVQELPSPVEHWWAGSLYRLQYCALTRGLRAAQVMKNIAIYNDEKTSGRFQKAVHIVRGVTPQQVRDALTEQTVQADQQGLLRYIQPLMVGAVDPKAEVGHDTIELASMPDAFNFDETMKWYLAILALAFLRDYQEFAPLPGGGLGTASQSQVLHMKSRGKGPALFQKIVQHNVNFAGIIPKSVTFQWNEQDVSAEQEEAALKQTRAGTIKILAVDSGVIDMEAARQLMIDDGDLPQEIYDGIIQREKAKAAEDAANLKKLAASVAANANSTATDEKPNEPGSQTDVTASDESRATAGPGGSGASSPAPKLTPPSAGLGGRGGLSQRMPAMKALVERVVRRAPAERRPELAEALEEAIRIHVDGRDGYKDLSGFLQTRIHRSFTTTADDLAALGYLTTGERIELSGLIGDCLRMFADGMDSPELFAAAAQELEQDDVQMLVAHAVKEIADAKASRMPADRAHLEVEVQGQIEDVLAGVFDTVRERIKRPGGKKSRWVPERRVVRDKQGRAAGTETLVED